MGVIVTDGVMDKFEPVRCEPYCELRLEDPPGVKVAPPGNDERTA